MKHIFLLEVIKKLAHFLFQLIPCCARPELVEGYPYERSKIPFNKFRASGRIKLKTLDNSEYSKKILLRTLLINMVLFSCVFINIYAEETPAYYSENIDTISDVMQEVGDTNVSAQENPTHHNESINTGDEIVEDFSNRANQKIGPSAITYKLNGGRFGDNLVSYCKAKLLSLLFDVPLLYMPFPYSDELMIHHNEKMYTQEQHKQFYATVQLIKKPPYILSKNNNTLYISRWKTEITIDWSDQNFLEEIKKNIAPINELEKVIIPEDCISVAAHVRNGGSFAADTAQEKERCPLRFVPEEFFIDQIQRITEMFPEGNIYVYIFTDHAKPKKLMKKFKNALNNPRITFDCRIEGNSHKDNVLEDFFSMMDFDCLIRPGSHYSRFVQRLGNNKVVIFPESVKEINGKKVIDTIKIKTRQSSSEKWKTQKIIIA